MFLEIMMCMIDLQNVHDLNFLHTNKAILTCYNVSETDLVYG